LRYQPIQGGCVQIRPGLLPLEPLSLAEPTKPSADFFRTWVQGQSPVFLEQSEQFPYKPVPDKLVPLVPEHNKRVPVPDTPVAMSGVPYKLER
jgi:hypothetical protein